MPNLTWAFVDRVFVCRALCRHCEAPVGAAVLLTAGGFIVCWYYPPLTASPWTRQKNCQVSLSHFSAGRTWPAHSTDRGPKEPGSVMLISKDAWSGCLATQCAWQCLLACVWLQCDGVVEVVGVTAKLTKQHHGAFCCFMKREERLGGSRCVSFHEPESWEVQENTHTHKYSLWLLGFVSTSHRHNTFSSPSSPILILTFTVIWPISYSNYKPLSWASDYSLEAQACKMSPQRQASPHICVFYRKCPHKYSWTWNNHTHKKSQTFFFFHVPIVTSFQQY